MTCFSGLWNSADKLCHFAPEDEYYEMDLVKESVGK